MHWHWYMMTTIMPICFTVCVSLIITQTKSLLWSQKIDNNTSAFEQKRELFCLYGQYIIGGLCATQCFLCHISNLFPEFYCIYGMSVCVILYAGTKTCLYGFFLERAKCVQNIVTIMPSFMWNYVFPGYIAFYFVVYLVLCPLAFRGGVVDPRTDESVPTACIFGEYHKWVFDLSAGVDLLNCFLFLFLFIYPLRTLSKKRMEEKMIAHMHMDHKLPHANASQHALTHDLREVIKYNVICSTICSISSITFLFVMSFSRYGDIGYYLWLGGNLDIMINSICLFLMLGTNRRFLRYNCAKLKGKTPVSKAKPVCDRSEAKKPESGRNTVTETTLGATLGVQMAPHTLQPNVSNMSAVSDSNPVASDSEI